MVPAASCMSSLITAMTALATIHLALSVMPIGCTPGHLSRAMSLHAKNGARAWGFTSVVESCFAKSANACHRSFEANLNAVHSLLQAWALRLDDPAAPLTLNEVERMRRESMLSNITGWRSRAGPCRVDSGSAGWPAGCLLVRTFLAFMESGVFWFSSWSSWSTPCTLYFVDKQV